MDKFREIINNFSDEQCLEGIKILSDRLENMDKNMGKNDKILTPFINKIQPMISDLTLRIRKYNEKYPDIFRNVDLSIILRDIIGSQEHRKYIKNIRKETFGGIKSDKYNASVIKTKKLYTSFKEMCGFPKKHGIKRNIFCGKRIEKNDVDKIYEMYNDLRWIIQLGIVWNFSFGNKEEYEEFKEYDKLVDEYSKLKINPIKNCVEENTRNEYSYIERKPRNVSHKNDSVIPDKDMGTVDGDEINYSDIDYGDIEDRDTDDEDISNNIS